MLPDQPRLQPSITVPASQSLASNPARLVDGSDDGTIAQEKKQHGSLPLCNMEVSSI